METDIQLIEKIKSERDNDSLKELINRHSGIYVSMVNNIINDSCQFVSKQEILEDKDLCIYQAAIKFAEEKNTKFSTYLAHETRWRCLNIYNKRKKMPFVELDEKTKETFVDNSYQDYDRIEIVKMTLKLASEHKDPRVKKIFDIRYNSGYNSTQPWRVVAQHLGMSAEGCIKIHDSFLKKIKPKLTT